MTPRCARAETGGDEHGKALNMSRQSRVAQRR